MLGQKPLYPAFLQTSLGTLIFIILTMILHVLAISPSCIILTVILHVRDISPSLPPLQSRLVDQRVRLVAARHRLVNFMAGLREGCEKAEVLCKWRAAAASIRVGVAVVHRA